MESANKPNIVAIIPAAGNSLRMNGIDKQQVEVYGKPVIIHTLLQFETSPWIRGIILACRQQDLHWYTQTCKNYGISKLFQIVIGGPTRQASVFAAIQAADEDTDYFAIHDGARPLVTQQLISETVFDAMRVGAAAPGVAAKETIKLVSAGLVKATPDRNSLVIIQTPQVIRADIYREAMAKAIADQLVFTDDCQLVEHLGMEVALSPGDMENIKLTTPVELTLAETILKNRYAFRR